MQGNLELLNSISWEDGESTSAVMPARASSRHTLRELWRGTPTLLPLVCREQFRLRLLLLPPYRVEEKGFPNSPEHDPFKPDTPIKTTSLLLMAGLSTTTFETQLPSPPSKCQTSSSLLTHPVLAF